MCAIITIIPIIIIIHLLFQGNWCEAYIGHHNEYNDSSSLTETVESADYADPSSYFQTLGDQEWESSDDNETEDNGESEHGTSTTLQHRALNYLVKIKEENRIPQRTVENIAFETSRLFQGALHNLQSSLTETLRNADVVLEDIPGAADCFDELSDCFEGLAKGWLPSDEKLPCVVGKHWYLMWQVHSGFLLVYVYCTVTSDVISLLFPLQEPKAVVLEKKRVIAKHNNKRRIVEKNEVFYCFHLKDNTDAVIRIKEHF